MVKKEEYVFAPSEINIKDKSTNCRSEDYLHSHKPVKLPLAGGRHHNQLNIVKLPKSSGPHKIVTVTYPKFGLNLS
jgi:hypothetical protein